MDRVILKDYCISEAYNPEHAQNYSSLAYATAFAPIFSRKNGSCSMMYIKMNSKYHRNIKYYFLVSIYYLPVFENFLWQSNLRKKMQYQFICNVKVSKSLRVIGFWYHSKKHTPLMEWSEGVWDSEKRNTNCLRQKYLARCTQKTRRHARWVGKRMFQTIENGYN